jgi:excisionase family DNA binding protein
MEQLLTVKQVAAQIAASEALVWKLVRQGRLPAVKINRMTRFRPSDVEALFRQRPA